MNTISASATSDKSASRALAYGVHLYTASGLICSGLVLAAISQAQPDFRLAFLWMTLAVVVDATDGFFARRLRVKQVLPHIDGRKLDDLVDFLNYTFLPLVLLWYGGWLPSPGWVWMSIPLVTSALAFSHTGAKEDEAGFFRGFPSYWNVVAFYLVVGFPWFGAHPRWIVAGWILLLSLLSLSPVRFVYPNRAPRYKLFFLGGGVIWLALLLTLMATFHNPSGWLIAASLVYPALYVALSFHLARVASRQKIPHVGATADVDQ